ncbi:kelch-like protein 35 [Oncorhynchus nerka]|uniref:kelch-like protein 35 n=1 Tax=Oncorhynchus nerka TaxID=8023 RepID=UPI00112FDED9|nr:kelch-like protein 35 [Oncorhynchus nerka]
MPGEVLKLPRPFLTMGFGSTSEPQPLPQGDQHPQWKEMSFCEGPRHSEQILQVLNVYRCSGTFTDMVLQVDSSEFPCHRAILSAGSIYFRTMFNGQLRESRQQLVRIQGIGASTMETVLNFVYEGKAVLDEANVGSVFGAADMLGVSVLSKACVQFLEERMDHSNCLGIMDFASSYLITPLADKCQTMLYRDFVEVYKHEEFLSLAKERVVELLTSEQLQVDKEEVLVEAVLKWVHHVPAERKGALQELLELVRLPLVDPVFFVNVIESDDLVQDCRECRPLLQEARMYHVLGREVDSVRTRPRKCMGRAEVIVVIGGCDRNGFSRLSFTEKLNPYTKEWVPGATIPGYSKSEFASCELQNEVYVSGGQLNSSDVWKYMPQVDHWVRVASLAKARWRHKMAALLGKLYAVGGFNGLERLSNVECYSVYDNQWRTVAPLLLAVSSAALVGCSGKLYVIGGAVNNDCNTNKVQCYNTEEDQWQYVSSCPFSQRCINATAHNNTIYVVGGLLDQIYSYTPKTDNWSKVVDLPMKLESCGLTVCEGKVYIVGGRDSCASATDQVWAYSPESGKLTDEKPMSRSVSYHGCVTVTQWPPKKTH